ncbi:MAG: hypothetical protein IPI64_00750 [Chloracidobacterium sp.]|nr:hypothetical protein [Chloracidobacterium sp.]
MKTGVCPKCNGTEIHVVENTATEVAIGLGWTATAFLNYYVCKDCGFVELFVQDKTLLPKLAEKYPKVN